MKTFDFRFRFYSDVRIVSFTIYSCDSRKKTFFTLYVSPIPARSNENIQNRSVTKRKSIKDKSNAILYCSQNLSFVFPPHFPVRRQEIVPKKRMRDNFPFENPLIKYRIICYQRSVSFCFVRT